jgi:hypothetical protein
MRAAEGRARWETTMSRRPSVFTQTDIARALKGAMSAGLKVARAEIDPSGKIVLTFADGKIAAEVNEWDQVGVTHGTHRS